MYTFLNVKNRYKCIYFCTEVCDFIKNKPHQRKNNPCQEVQYGYILVNNFVKKLVTGPDRQVTAGVIYTSGLASECVRVVLSHRYNV